MRTKSRRHCKTSGIYNLLKTPRSELTGSPGHRAWPIRWPGNWFKKSGLEFCVSLKDLIILTHTPVILTQKGSLLLTRISDPEFLERRNKFLLISNFKHSWTLLFYTSVIPWSAVFFPFKSARFKTLLIQLKL